MIFAGRPGLRLDFLSGAFSATLTLMSPPQRPGLRLDARVVPRRAYTAKGHECARIPQIYTRLVGNSLQLTPNAPLP